MRNGVVTKSWIFRYTLGTGYEDFDDTGGGLFNASSAELYDQFFKVGRSKYNASSLLLSETFYSSSSVTFASIYYMLVLHTATCF